MAEPFKNLCNVDVIDALAGHLLSVDPSTGNAKDLGDTGRPGLVALTDPFSFVAISSIAT